MSKTELDRLCADLGGHLGTPLGAAAREAAASDPASFDLVGWATANGYDITPADLPAAPAAEGPLDDATLDGMAGGNDALAALQRLQERGGSRGPWPPRPLKTTERP